MTERHEMGHPLDPDADRPAAPDRAAGPADYDDQRVARAVAELLRGAGEDVGREELAATPERVAALYRRLLGGRAEDPVALLGTGLPVAGGEQVVLLRDLAFCSLCEHHLLPFCGRVHVGYLPDGQVAGAGRIARAVEALARRLQLQERMTEQVADALGAALAPRGVAVVVEAEHLCMRMRGDGDAASRLVTGAFRGQLAEPAERAAFLALLGAPGGR